MMTTVESSHNHLEQISVAYWPRSRFKYYLYHSAREHRRLPQEILGSIDASLSNHGRFHVQETTHMSMAATFLELPGATIRSLEHLNARESAASSRLLVSA